MSELVLPEDILPPTTVNPRKMLIFSAPKVGKTTLMAGLEDALIIDLEKGTDYVAAKKIQVNSIADLRVVARLIKEKNAAKGGFFYKYIVIDTITKLEEIVKELAIEIHKKRPLGKTFKGDHYELLALPNGAGYGPLREAFEIVYNMFSTLCEHLILVGHLKKTSSIKANNGAEISARDIQLTGRLKEITCMDVDAIGYLYRTEGNKCVLSFKTSEDDMITGARPTHLKNTEIVVSELIDGRMVYHWDKVYIPEN